jgi:hypothetical protein
MTTRTAADTIATRTSSTELAQRSQDFDIIHTLKMIRAASENYAPLIAADFLEALERCDTFHQRQKLIRKVQSLMKESIEDE